jgi:methylated-DNA-[protein]-cysteine S-methyltransferase
VCDNLFNFHNNGIHFFTTKIKKKSKVRIFAKKIMNTRDFVYHYDTPLGGMTMASDGEALIGLWFDGQQYYASTLGSKQEQRMLSIFEDTSRWLDVYFTGQKPDFTPKLRLIGTPFRQMVWQQLLAIPYGQTVSYADIAHRIAQQRGLTSMSAQAIGGAVGHNPISLIIPCHRVIGTDGSLTGYAAGIDRKRWLLNLEKGE